MLTRSIGFLFVLYACLFMFDGCGPKCPSVGKSTLDYFFVEQAYETDSGYVLEANEEGVYPLEAGTTFRFMAAVNTEEIALARPAIFSAFALSCIDPGLLESDTKLDPESVIISINKDITIDSNDYSSGANLRVSEGITFSEDGYNAFYVSLNEAFIEQVNNTSLILTIVGGTFDGIEFQNHLEVKRK